MPRPLIHLSQAVKIIYTYRDMLFDHLNIYNTGVSNRLNEIMKVLTIFLSVVVATVGYSDIVLALAVTGAAQIIRDPQVLAAPFP